MATNSTRQYKEGILQKRARGLHTKKAGGLKWQERYCRLTNVSLDYYEPKKMNVPKGQFKVEQIQIVEVVSTGLFDKLKGNPFQVGDCSEVMYFATKTPQERNEWMEAFRQVARDKGVKCLPKYHPGVYGLTNKDRWSCCGRALRESEGCSQTTVERIRSQTTPVDLDHPSSVLSPLKKTQKDELSSSFTSINSNSTLTEQDVIIPMKRTYTIAEEPMKRPSISRQKRMQVTKSLADPTGSSSQSSDSTVTSPTTPTGETMPTITDDTGTSTTKDKVVPSVTPSSGTIVPPQLEELGRSSGASSPAPSTDSGRGTTSRPSSILTSDCEPVPTTPQSTRSQITNMTTDSDQTRSIGGGSDGGHDRDAILVRRRQMDTHSILSDVSGLSGYSSGTLPLHMRRRQGRPQSVAYKDGVAFSISEMSITSNESTAMTDTFMKLHQACKEGNLKNVIEELDTGAAVEEQQIFNGVPTLPLFISFLYDHRHVMVYLLEHGADPNSLDMTTRSCLLHWACQRGCMETVKILIHFKADINMKNHEDNTPLSEASKYGHTEIVKVLLENDARVNFEGGQGHTPLHYASSAGHADIVRTLLQYNADPLKKTSKKRTPYHLAFVNERLEVLNVLNNALTTTTAKPYSLKGSHQTDNEQKITSLTFVSSGSQIKLAAGSRDCITRVFSVSCDDDGEDDCLALSTELQLANTILSVSSHSPHIAMGSAFIQVADVLNDSGWRRTVADDSCEDESLEDPPLHFVSFTSEGLLVTAGVESDTVKIWPAVNEHSVISQPLKVFNASKDKGNSGSVYRLVTSPASDSPWVGIVVQPGPPLAPSGNKQVYIYNWKEEKIYHIIDTGDGGVLVGVHIAFTNDGNHFIIACKDKLTKWSTAGGDRVLSTVQDDDISCVCVSPDGRHIAVGLVSGDTHILDSQSGMLVFPLRYTNDRSSVSSLAYSECSSYLATGHSRGSLQLWKVN